MAKPKRTSIPGAGRFYVCPPQGLSLVSVTTIGKCWAKPALVNWSARLTRNADLEAAADLYERVEPGLERGIYLAELSTQIGAVEAHEKELERASDIGTRLHKQVEYVLRKEAGLVGLKKPETCAASGIAFAAWQVWRQGVGLDAVHIEQTIYSETHEYAGQLDLYGKATLPDVGRVNVLVDWKTSKSGIWSDSVLQNAAYMHAFQEMGHCDRDTYGVIVRLPKAADSKPLEIKVIPPSEQATNFSAFLALKQIWHWTHRNAKWYREMMRVNDAIRRPVPGEQPKSPNDDKRWARILREAAKRISDEKERAEFVANLGTTRDSGGIEEAEKAFRESKWGSSKHGV